MKTILSLGAYLVLGTAAIQASPSVILFDNNIDPFRTYGYTYADTTNPYQQEAGSIFTPAASGSADHIIFNGAYLSSDPFPSDSFIGTLYQASSGASLPNPMVVLGTSHLSVTRVSQGFIIGGYEIFRYEGDIDIPFTVYTGNNYYLGISDTTTPGVSFGLALNTSATAKFNVVKSGSDYSVYPNDVGSSFQISGPSAVPEPSTWAVGLVCFVGVLGLGLYRQVA